MIILSPYPKLQFIDNNGNPMAGCLLFTYAAGTDSPLATFTDQSGTAYNQNPIILDAGGRASVWLDSNLSYKYKLLNADGTVLFTVDDINNTTSNQILTVNTIADLIAIDTTQLSAATYQVLGYNAVNDGGGGLFYFASGSAVDGDGGMIFEPTTGPGRWLRIVGADTEINIKWYGATGNGADDAEPMIQAANAFAAEQSPNWSIYLPAGTWTLNTNPTLTVPVRMAVGARLNWGNFILAINPIFGINDFTMHFITTGGIDFTEKAIDISPEWFGAVGDGSMTSNTPGTDDTAAIQAAIDSCAPGQRVILNSSKKYWSSQLVLKPGISICGSLSDQHFPHPAGNDFVSNLVFYASGTSFLNLTNSDVGDLRGVTIRDLIIDGINNNATIGIYLQTSGSLIENCTIRNCLTAITINGTTCNSNRIIGNCIVDCATGIAGGPASGNIVMGNSFVSCTNDIILTAPNGWTVAANSQSSSPVPGAVAHLFGVTDYNDALLPTAVNASVELGKIGGLAVTTSMSSGLSGLADLTGLPGDANFWNRKYIITAADSNTRLHDSLGGDNISITPRVDTRAWYERDLDGGHHWGDKDKEFMRLDGAGNLTFPSQSAAGAMPMRACPGGTVNSFFSILDFQEYFGMVTISPHREGMQLEMFPCYSATTPTSYAVVCSSITIPAQLGLFTTDNFAPGENFQVGQWVAFTTETPTSYASDPNFTANKKIIYGQVMAFDSVAHSITVNFTYYRSLGSSTIVSTGTAYLSSAFPFLCRQPTLSTETSPEAAGVIFGLSSTFFWWTPEVEFYCSGSPETIPMTSLTAFLHKDGNL